MHFHLHECGSVTADEEGREVADLDTAYKIALKAAREVMCAELSHGKLCLSCHIEVRSETGETLFEIAFRDAVVISGMDEPNR